MRFTNSCSSRSLCIMSVKSLIFTERVFSEYESDLVDQTNRIYMLGPEYKIKEGKGNIVTLQR